MRATIGAVGIIAAGLVLTACGSSSGTEAQGLVGGNPSQSSSSAEPTTASPTPSPTPTPTPTATPSATKKAAATPAATPTKKASPTPAKTTAVKTDKRYSSCAKAKAAGLGPYYKGKDPEYGWYKDRDGDGVVCE